MTDVVERVARAIFASIWPKSDPDEIVYSAPSMGDPGQPLGPAWQEYAGGAATAALSALAAPAVSAERRAVPDEVAALRAALEQAAAWFDEYANHHQETGQAIKAGRNRHRALWLRSRAGGDAQGG